jgi:4a-hydroxytetrahydrobiopterin dehydratase
MMHQATEPFTFFISYRRRDTAPIALLLKYEIEKRLQFVRVLVDVEDIRQGEHFPSRLEQMVSKSHATLVLVGQRWMPLTQATAKPADHPPNDPPDQDWIVSEILLSNNSPVDYDEINQYGLDRRAILPIFVNCACNFSQFQLPEEIQFISQIHAETITYAGWPVAIGPLIERIAINLNLKQRPTTDEYPTPDPVKARTQPLSDRELTATLQYSDYAGWYIDNSGDTDVRYLAKTFKFPDFDQAAEFMSKVADYCRTLGHHPEWRNVFNHVTVSLTTWDARRRVTIYDLNLALFMNKVAMEVGKQAK